MDSQEPYAVYAVRYAQRVAPRHSMFLGFVERPDEPMAMDYFTWLAVSPTHTVGIDTGFTRETAARLQRDYIASPLDTMRRLGVQPEDVSHVVVTHFHYDHAGNVEQFPNARIVLQREEMAYWTGPYAGRTAQHGQPARDFTYLVEANLAGKVQWVDGDAEIAPGVSVHLVRGHTAGMQVVRVATASGPLVLASDASHYYENIEHDRPFRAVHTVPLMYAAFDRVKELAGGRLDRVVPGHDPLVMERYPAASDALRGLVVKLA